MENMHVKEEFREIDGYAGRYSVSNYGMVITIRQGVRWFRIMGRIHQQCFCIVERKE